MKKSLQSPKNMYIPIIVIVFSGWVSGCATVQQVVKALRPDVKLKDVRIVGLTFEAAELLLDIEVDNPNPLPIALTGIDYDLKINDISFLKGQQPKQLNIDALDANVFQFPVSLNYKNLYETFQSLKDQDMSAYHIDCGLSFKLPGLGLTRVPFSTAGEFPVVKIPLISVDTLKVNTVNLTGADMELRLHMKNPNAFNLLLNQLDYELLVNGKSWAKGMGMKQIEVSSKGESTISIPIALDFTQIGFTVYQILSGDDTLEYSLKGALNIGSSLPLLQQTTLPFNTSGLLNIQR